jgi:plastocyanin
MSRIRHVGGVLILLAFGCTDDEGPTILTAAAVDAAASAGDLAAPTTVSSPKTVDVAVGPNNSIGYAPSSVTINAGDTVRWSWSSTSIPHTVTSGTPGNADGKFCSATSVPSVGACSADAAGHFAPFTYSFTFATAGTFPFFCLVHGSLMTGTVVVH